MSVYGTVIVNGVAAAWMSVPMLQLRLRPPKRARRARRRRSRPYSTRPAFVYRFVDNQGRRGYIGKTTNLRRRLREHGFNPDHVEVLTCPSEAAALDVERAAIRADAQAGQPLVNIIHNGRTGLR